jgi:hypothetical protein
MRLRTRTSLVVLCTLAWTVAAAASASASRISMSNQNIRMVWSSFEYIPTGAGTTIRCPLTLEGSFHSNTFTKVAGLLIGYITRANSDNARCTNGTAWILNGEEQQDGVTLGTTLPWHIQYDGFAGTLPSFTRVRVRIVGFAYLLRFAGVNCLYQSTQTEPQPLLLFREVSGRISSVQIEGRTTLRTGFVCPATSQLSGGGTYMLLGTVNPVTIRLI